MNYDVVIIGGGPSGLTASIYTSRANLKTLVLAGDKPGGQLMLTTEVDNYPGFPEGIMGPALMSNMRKQAARFGTEIKDEVVTEIDIKTLKLKTAKEEYEAKAVIIATGADTKWLGVPGEEALIGRGISSCAPCDAFFFKEKQVIVVGGGDSAMEEALVLTKFASAVTIIHRRAAFRASKIMQDKVLTHPKIKVIWNSEVVKVNGEAKVESVLLKIDGKETEMKIDGVFVAVGHIPNTSIFKDKLELDEKGFLKIFPGSKTSVEGVFVSGDVHDHTYKQAITAAGFGCMAAMDAEKWLER
ncbi:MAG: thioredoxin-disulfide reductase [bacterium]|nr:thioredoxin-disulfide reductase [bacterium]